MEKSKSGIIIIMAAVVSMLLLGASGMDPKKMTEAEIEALLKPEQYIAVDTLEDSHYLVKFMKGEKTIKELELKIGFKEYKETAFTQDSNPKSDRMTRIINKDSIYSNPTIYLSSNNTKIAIRWENLIKREEIQENWYISDMKRYGNYDHRTGLRNIDKIEVYNEDGKKMYTVDGEEAGWDTTKDWKSPDKVLNKEGIRYYESSAPYCYIVNLYNDGMLTTTNSKGMGLLTVAVKVVTPNGKVALEIEPRAVLKGSDIVYQSGKVYYLSVNGDSVRVYMADKNGVEKKTLTDSRKCNIAYILGNEDGLYAIVERLTDVWETSENKIENTKVYLLDNNMKIQKEFEIDTSLLGMYSGQPIKMNKGFMLWCRLGKDKGVVAYQVTKDGEIVELKHEGNIGYYVKEQKEIQGKDYYLTMENRDWSDDSINILSIGDDRKSINKVKRISKSELEKN